MCSCNVVFFFSSRRRHTRCSRDWSSDVCSSDLLQAGATLAAGLAIPPMLRASAEHSLPNPIPGGLDLLGNGHIFHVYLPGTSPELSSITDFNGVLGTTEVLGNWSGGAGKVGRAHG